MDKYKISMRNEQRFWSQVFMRGEDECWVFTGGTMDKRGRGRFHINGKHIMAQRIAFGIEYGYIPECAILRTCKDVSCVNPKHLEPAVKDEYWTGPSNTRTVL
jgi:hypothetical protein